MGHNKFWHPDRRPRWPAGELLDGELSASAVVPVNLMSVLQILAKVLSHLTRALSSSGKECGFSKFLVRISRSEARGNRTACAKMSILMLLLECIAASLQHNPRSLRCSTASQVRWRLVRNAERCAFYATRCMSTFSRACSRTYGLSMAFRKSLPPTCSRPRLTGAMLYVTARSWPDVNYNIADQRPTTISLISRVSAMAKFATHMSREHTCQTLTQSSCHS